MTDREIRRMIRRISKRRHKATIQRYRNMQALGPKSVSARDDQERIERYTTEIAELFARL